LTSIKFYKVDANYWEIYGANKHLGYIDTDGHRWMLTAYREQFSAQDLSDILQKLNELNENLSNR